MYTYIHRKRFRIYCMSWFVLIITDKAKAKGAGRYVGGVGLIKGRPELRSGRYVGSVGLIKGVLLGSVGVIWKCRSYQRHKEASVLAKAYC